MSDPLLDVSLVSSFPQDSFSSQETHVSVFSYAAMADIRFPAQRSVSAVGLAIMMNEKWLEWQKPMVKQP